MKKKVGTVLFGVVALVLAYRLGAPFWVYALCLLPVLGGLAWLGVYDAKPSRDSYEKWGDASRHGGGEGGGGL